MKTKKNWEDLGLSDNFIFQKVMMNEKLCRKILSEIIGKEVVKVDYSAYERTIQIRSDAKGVRLDIYLKDQEDVIYNVEIQNSDNDSLPKRSRYYHDMIDLDLLEKGEHYKSLNRSIVIFICTFDPFDKGFYKYTFTHRCEEASGMEMEDGAMTIFMNAKGHIGNISDDCKDFLKCIAGQFTKSSFSAILKEEVTRVKESREWRKDYMYFELMIEDAKEEGKQEGKKEGITKINRLHKCLLDDNRYDDLKRAVDDMDYQQKLMEEYHID